MKPKPIPPDVTGMRFPNRKSALDKPVREAISPEYSQNFLDEIIAFEPQDIKQLRKQMNDLFVDELNVLQDKLNKLRDAIYEIKYERSPAGQAAREKRNEQRRARQRKPSNIT